jgi:hypothetical protein
LGPHNTARATFYESIVQLLQSLLSIDGGVVVDIGISEGSTSDSITANTNRSNRSDLGEKLEEHGFSDGGVELADVEGGRSLRVRGSRAWGRSSSIRILRVNVGDIGIDGRSAVRIASIQGSIIEVISKLVDSRSGSGRHPE